MEKTKPNSRYAYIIKCLVEEVDDDKFNDWEQGFISNMEDLLEKFGDDRIDFTLSDKQRECLERIWRKY